MPRHKHEWERISNHYQICRDKDCGKEKFVEFPLKDKEGNKIIKNFFKMDGRSIVMFCLVIFLLWGYQADMENAQEIIYDPCGYCKKANCCDYLRLLERNPSIENQIEMLDDLNIGLYDTEPSEI